MTNSVAPSDFLERIRIRDALARLAGVVRKTPLERFDAGGERGERDDRIELWLKLECLQEVGAFKARGAWNQIAQLSPAEKAAGVVTVSSGNHGKALAWAAQRAGVRATVVMPHDAYPNKIAACREFGAEVVLAPSRAGADVLCAELVAAGATLVHPYDAERTIQGAGTVGLEIAEQLPDVDVVVVPVGGGGLIAGIALAIRQSIRRHVYVIGAEPELSATMTEGLRAGRSVTLSSNTSKVQGLCPPNAGALNVAICARHVDHVVTLADERIVAAQAVLVNRGGWVVEPAGAAAVAVVLERKLPSELLAGRTRAAPLRVVCVVSGGNPDPAQLESVRKA